MNKALKIFALIGGLLFAIAVATALVAYLLPGKSNEDVRTLVGIALGGMIGWPAGKMLFDITHE